jgi:RNA polymerase sigma-70 factor (ECF subfamily)
VPQSLPIERFRLIYETNYPRILAYALRRTASPEDAADVVSETFATAWRRLADLPSGEETPLWLYGVARRILANHRRQEHQRGRLKEMLATDYEESAWRDTPPSDFTALKRAWSRLGPEDQDLLGLLVWEALTNDQIAKIVGCSRNVAKLRIHRARKRFARELTRAGIDVKPFQGSRHVAGERTCVRPDTEEM